MRIPERIKIGGYVVMVKQVEGLYADHDAIGQFVPRTQEIYMEKEVSPQQAEEVLIHELLEALNYFYRLGIKHSQIVMLGVLLHQVMKDNPGMFCDDNTATGAG